MKNLFLLAITFIALSFASCQKEDCNHPSDLASELEGNYMVSDTSTYIYNNTTTVNITTYTISVGRINDNQIYMIGFGDNNCTDTIEATVSEKLVVVTKNTPSNYACAVKNPIINKEGTTLKFTYNNNIGPYITYYKGKAIKQ